jgi:hypothetical protein
MLYTIIFSLYYYVLLCYCVICYFDIFDALIMINVFKVLVLLMLRLFVEIIIGVLVNKIIIYLKQVIFQRKK